MRRMCVTAVAALAATMAFGAALHAQEGRRPAGLLNEIEQVGFFSSLWGGGGCDAGCKAPAARKPQGCAPKTCAPLQCGRPLCPRPACPPKPICITPPRCVVGMRPIQRPVPCMPAKPVCQPKACAPKACAPAKPVCEPKACAPKACVPKACAPAKPVCQPKACAPKACGAAGCDSCRPSTILGDLVTDLRGGLLQNLFTVRRSDCGGCQGCGGYIKGTIDSAPVLPMDDPYYEPPRMRDDATDPFADDPDAVNIRPRRTTAPAALVPLPPPQSRPVPAGATAFAPPPTPGAASIQTVSHAAADATPPVAATATIRFTAEGEGGCRECVTDQPESTVLRFRVH